MALPCWMLPVICFLLCGSAAPSTFHPSSLSLLSHTTRPSSTPSTPFRGSRWLRSLFSGIMYSNGQMSSFGCFDRHFCLLIFWLIRSLFSSAGSSPHFDICGQAIYERFLPHKWFHDVTHPPRLFLRGEIRIFEGKTWSSPQETDGFCVKTMSSPEWMHLYYRRTMDPLVPQCWRSIPFFFLAKSWLLMLTVNPNLWWLNNVKYPFVVALQASLHWVL